LKNIPRGIVDKPEVSILDFFTGMMFFSPLKIRYFAFMIKKLGQFIDLDVYKQNMKNKPV
jgi:hypothetical protein